MTHRLSWAHEVRELGGRMRGEEKRREREKQEEQEGSQEKNQETTCQVKRQGYTEREAGGRRRNPEGWRDLFKVGG